MQDQVAEPLEKRMQELRWYDRTETFTRPGLAFMTVTLRDSTPPADVQEEFYQARKKLGDEAGQPAARRDRAAGQRRIFGRHLRALRAEGQGRAARACWSAKRRRCASACCTCRASRRSTSSASSPERIFVEFSYDRLATLGVAPQDLFAALNSQNAMTPAGSIETKGPQVFIRLDGAFDDLQKIRDTPDRRAAAAR